MGQTVTTGPLQVVSGIFNVPVADGSQCPDGDNVSITDAALQNPVGGSPNELFGVVTDGGGSAGPAILIVTPSSSKKPLSIAVGATVTVQSGGGGGPSGGGGGPGQGAVVSGMAALSAQIFALLTHDDAIEGAIGRPYHTVSAEAWSLPGDVNYPVLAFTVDSEIGNLPLAVTNDFVIAKLKCWFYSDISRYECLLFSDALKARLHQRQWQLMRDGSLLANLIKWSSTRILKDAAVDKHLAFVQFDLIA